MNIFANAQSPASKALEKFVERYMERVWQVERLGEHTVRAWLKDGSVFAAMLLPDGGVKIWELEG